MPNIRPARPVPASVPASQRFSLAKAILLLLALFVGLRLVYWHFFLPARVRASDLTIENILTAINHERSLRNLLTLNTDSRLSSAAQSKADDMQARHYFSHTDPEGNYIWPKIVAAGYTPYLELGENLAIEFYNTESLVNAWMNSPTHRANILNDGFKDQGMGLDFGNADIGQYHSVIANTFGTLAVKKTTPPPPAVKSQTTNPAPAPTPTPEPKTPAPAPQAPVAKSAPAPQENPTAGPTTTPSQLAIRGDGSAGYALPQSSPPAESASNTSPAPAAATPATNTQFSIPTAKNPQDLTRYFSLALAALIIVFIVSDIKDAFKNKLAGLDKKINNLVLLVLALLVLIFLYWL
ncbi:MAG: CAP domain-containing protein [Patescibacteria group bacterium]|nr:CAP domain-containing protein [Patescibacteria group bacterium]